MAEKCAFAVNTELISGNREAGEWDESFIHRQIRHLLRKMKVESLRGIVGHLEGFFDGKRPLVPNDTFSFILANLVTTFGSRQLSDFFLDNYRVIKRQADAQTLT